MRASKIIFKGFKRFLLNGLNYLEYTPESTDQIILGTNGSGKSSLLKALLEHPDGKDFAKDGYIIRHFHKHGIHYELSSRYPTRPGHHSFLKDGVELNEGATGAIQKVLMERELGLTPLVIDVLTGKSRFSTMGPQDRREVIMLLSGTDFGYALDMHQKVKTTTRDLKGFLETSDEQMASQQKDIQLLEAEAIESEAIVEQLESELQLLSVERVRDYVKPNEVTLMLNSTEMELTDLAIKLVRETANPPDVVAMGRGELEDGLRDLEYAEGQHRRDIQRIADEIDALPRIVQSGESCPLSEEALRERLARVQEERAKLTREVVHYEEISPHSKQLLEMALELKPKLEDLTMKMPINNDGQFTRDGFRELKEASTVVADDIRRTVNQRDKAQTHIDHLSRTDHVDCPECKFKFRPGVDESILAEKRAFVATCTEALEKLERRSSELSERLAEYEAYFDQIRTYKALNDGYSSLKVFWGRVLFDELLYKSPWSIPTELHRYIYDLRLHAQIVDLKQDEERYAVQLETLSAAGGAAFITRQRAALEDRLHAEHEGLRLVQRRLVLFRKVLDRVVNMEKMRDRVLVLIEEYFKLRERLQEAHRQEMIAQTMSAHYEFIGKRRHTVQQYRVLAGTYEVMCQQREVNVRKYEAYKLLTQALSPNEGIVAEAVKDFIAYFGGLMNDHIGRVWNYGMEVKPVVEVDTNLNWKFPLHIKHTEQEVPDVALGSSGQVSMVDFAFKLVFMELLGLNDMPLLVDEFGKDFDMEHRERLVRYIKGLLQEGKFDQMFMVSHYASVYGSFNQAEYLVLDDRNITTPERYNEHCVMH